MNVTRAEIDAALAHPSPRPFAPTLEARYEADGGARRRRRLGVTLALAAASILAALALDARHTPAGQLLDRFVWRAGATVALLAAAAAAQRVRTPGQEAAVVTLAALVGMGVVEVMGERAPIAVASAYMVAAMALVAGIIASGQVRFSTALVACASCATAFPLLMLAFPGVLPLPRSAGNPEAAVIGFSILCIAARRNEISRRTEYLHRLRHEVVEAEMGRLNAELMTLSTTDMLTGLANRRHFETEARRLWDDRDQAPFALAMVDVDRFKAFNDAAGHAAGDRCLVAVAEALRGAMRHDSDRAARYGGEEFAILMPGAHGGEPAELGERLRRAVEAMRIPHPGLPGQTVTVSVGVSWQRGREGSLDALLGDADRLLYLAKETGRNRSCWRAPA